MPEHLSHLPLPKPKTEAHRVISGPRDQPALPERDPRQHAAGLIDRLEFTEERLSELSKVARPAASEGFLVTATFTDASSANIDGLADKRAGIAVVDSFANKVLVHTPTDRLRPLHSKLRQYADPAKVSKKTGLPRNAKLVSPLVDIEPATLVDLSDGWLRPDALSPKELVWVEMWAEGGHLGGPEQHNRVRLAIAEFMGTHGLDIDNLASYAATEHDIYLLELTGAALMDVPVHLPDVHHLSPPPKPIVPALLDHQAEMDVPIPPNPPEDASVVAILDTGVAETHPLLANSMLAPPSTVIPGETSGADTHGHGTRMAGVAAFSDLAHDLNAGQTPAPRVWMQGIRLTTGQDRPKPEFMLERTEDAVHEAERVDVPRRIFSLSLGAPTAQPGGSTPWSVTVDRLAYNEGSGRLICVAAGNEPISGTPNPTLYPNANLSAGLTSPGEAVNAITVGAITELDQTSDPNRRSLAASGELSPWSRCDVGGLRPVKPDVVTEGGNVSTDGVGTLDDASLQLLTTAKGHTVGPWLATTSRTSAATARIAGLLGEIWSANEGHSAQTVRALLIHSARWSEAMKAQLPDSRDRMRAFGYGWPLLDSAAWSERTRPTLIAEARLDPEANQGPGREMHFYELPMPDDELSQLEDHQVELSVTLSYFVEPNEKRTRRYQSAGLRWDLQRFETRDEFRKRINRLEREQDPDYENRTERFPWELGPQARERGTVQSDRMRLAASELLGGRALAVWPVAGWWRDRNLSDTPPISYSLVVTIDAGDADVDLYTSIDNLISVQT